MNAGSRLRQCQGRRKGGHRGASPPLPFSKGGKEGGESALIDKGEMYVILKYT
jgi:hypothetical protein